MKDIFQKIIDICEEHKDEEKTLADIRIKAKNRVIRYEWEEKYGIKLDSRCRLAEYDYFSINDYQNISYFKDGYYCKKNNEGRSISWSEGNKQPVDEWIYQITFSTGAYVFGDDYNGQQQLFKEFFEELRTYKPDYEDLHNHKLYWKIENSKKIMEEFPVILKRYREKNQEELKERKINKLKAELDSLIK